MTTSTPKPTPRKPRLVGLDVARALAIFGMVIINLSIVSIMFSDNGFNPFSNFVWGTINGLIGGRAAATFVILAGIGTAIGSRNKLSLYKRALFLLLFGYLWLPIWPADILHFYAFYIAVGTTFLFIPERWFRTSLLVAIGFLLAGTTLYLVLGPGFFANYNGNGDYEGLWTPVGFFTNLFLDGYHPIIPWLGFFLFGMLLGTFNLAKRKTQVVMLAGGLCAALLFERLSAIAIANFGAEFGMVGFQNYSGWANLLWTNNGQPPSPFYVLAGGATATAFIGGISLIVERFPVAKWVSVLSRTGQLALTVYVGHYFLGVLPISSLAEAGVSFPAWLGYLWAAAYYALVLVFAWHWKKRFKRGPLEAILRWFSDSRWFGRF